jgi:hypothetical protein
MNDKAIQEIRSIRHRISEEFDHDPQQYIDYLNNQNAKYKRQIELYRKLCEREAEFSEVEIAG